MCLHSFLTSALVVYGQFHVPSALPPRKVFPVPVKEEAGVMRIRNRNYKLDEMKFSKLGIFLCPAKRKGVNRMIM